MDPAPSSGWTLLRHLGGPALDLGYGLASEFNQLLPAATERTQYLSRPVDAGDPPQAGDGANLPELPKFLPLPISSVTGEGC